MKLRHITPLLAAAGAAAAIVAAPSALAADTDQSCTTTPGVDTVCSSPGNVQINDSAPVQFGPQYPYWAGDYFGGYGYGGGHAGGHR
jgi:hypothetical protein